MQLRCVFLSTRPQRATGNNSYCSSAESQWTELEMQVEMKALIWTNSLKLDQLNCGRPIVLLNTKELIGKTHLGWCAVRGQMGKYSETVSFILLSSFMSFHVFPPRCLWHSVCPVACRYWLRPPRQSGEWANAVETQLSIVTFCTIFLPELCLLM